MSRWICFLCLVLTALPAAAFADTIPIDDLEPPVPLPEQILEASWLRPALAAALLAVIILLLFLRWKKKFQQEHALSPAETAGLALAQAEQLIAAHQCAAFAALFEQTLRRYLEAGLGMAALHQTAGELIRHIDKKHGGLPEVLESYSKELENWLRCCEAGKFAGAALSQEEMSEMITQMRAFIAAVEEHAQRNTDGQLSLR